MKRIVFLGFLLLFTTLAFAQERSDYLSIGRCANWLNGSSLMKKITAYDCINLDCSEDSCLATPLDSSLISLLKSNYPNSGTWHFNHIYTIGGYENIRLFWLLYPDDPELTGVDVAYNIHEQKYYLLRGIDIKGMNELLGMTHPFFINEPGILRYCWLITFLKNSPNPVIPIASVQDAVLIIFNIATIYDLDYLKPSPELKAELPVIEKTGDTINVTYYMLIQTHITKIGIKLKENKILDYTQEDIGSVLAGY
jgi:hypothetical protein